MIAIVTDSTAYLTKAQAHELGVHVVPISYTVSGQLFHESYSDHNGDFEQLLARNTGRTSTSQTSVSTFMGVFEELISNGYEVLCLVISSRLSGVYNSASVAAREVNPEKIVVVDSLTTAGGLSLLLREAWQLAQSGISLDELARSVEKKREHVGIVFSVDNMDALRRSGRLGVVRQSVGTVLNLRPLLMFEQGGIVSYGVTRGHMQQIRALAERIPADAKSIIMHYYDSKTDPLPLNDAIKKKCLHGDITICRIGPVLGIHLGVGVIGAAWITA